MTKKKLFRTAAAVIVAAAVCTGQVGAELFPTEDYTGSNIDANNYRYYYGNSDTDFSERHNWANPVRSYLTECEDGFMRFQTSLGEEDYLVEYYSSSYKFLESRIITAELPLFGAFYATEDNYYILSGQNNLYGLNDAEVFRITKYDTDWNRTDSVGLYGANTIIPFHAGSARMTDDGTYLYIRTCHEMFGGHQANVTIKINMANMEIVYSYYDILNVYDKGYVSHSFNQFVRVDSDGSLVTIDHGDAYPRSVVLVKFEKPGTHEYSAFDMYKQVSGSIILNDSSYWAPKSISKADLIGDIDPDFIEYVDFGSVEHEITVGYNATEPIYDFDKENPYWNQLTIPALHGEDVDDISFGDDYCVMIGLSTEDEGDYEAYWSTFYTFDPDEDETLYVEDVVDMFDIYGETGSNYTGVMAGGFEISDTAYIVTGSSVIQDEDYKSRRTNNIFVSALPKGSDEAKITWITDYKEGEGVLSNPHLTKLDDDRFLLIWSKGGTVFYTELNGNGEQTSEVYSFEGQLSDCVPTVINGEVVWYAWENWDYLRGFVNGEYIYGSVRSLTYYTINANDISKHDTHDFSSVPGDVNKDASVDDLDVVALARYLAGWNVTIDEAAADVDGSGEVDDLDVVMLARRLAGWNV